MTTTFVDTSYYIALLNPRDSLHAKARAMRGDYALDLLTTDFVLLELGNWCAQRRERPLFTQFLGLIRRDPGLMILPASRELVDLGAGLYAQRPDKDWSLTDCISFGVMEERHIREALTADQHFRQAGFTILLE
jgi:uncharacterized protein